MKQDDDNSLGESLGLDGDDSEDLDDEMNSDIDIESDISNLESSDSNRSRHNYEEDFN